MATMSTEQLTQQTCKPCEGGVDKYTPEQAREQLAELAGWQLDDAGEKISKSWTVKNFVAGINFLDEVAKVAEDENHHPDLHLTGYKNVRIELSTHAIGGLSENDFVLAAKIDQLPVETKS